MSSTPDQSTRRLWKKLLLIPAGLAAGLVIGWGAIEAWDATSPRPRRITAEDYSTVRFMLDDNYTERGLYLFDEQIGYRFKPNNSGIRHQTDDSPHLTNSLGLLGGRELDPDPAVRKVLVLGDSVTYGDGIPFDAIFVSRMQDIAGPELQLVNGACPGWNLEQQIGFYEAYVERAGWNAVVFCLCLNDFVEFGWAATPQGNFDWMMLESVSTFDRLRLKYTRNRFQSSKETGPLFRHDDACMLSWQSDRVASCLREHLSPFLKSSSRPPVIVVLLPSRYQFDALGRGAPTETALSPQHQVNNFCTAHGIACLDAVELLTQVDEPFPESSDIFLAGDALHFNDAGHARLAEALWPALREELSASTGDERSE